MTNTAGPEILGFVWLDFLSLIGKGQVLNNQALRFITLLIGLLSPVLAQAHVKWFAPYDLTKAPMPIGEVLTPTFLYFFIVSVVFVYIVFAFDRFFYKRNFLSKLDNKLRRLDQLSMVIMRACAGIFFLSLWASHQFFGSTFFLTPELKTQAVWVPWLQLSIGIAALSHRTSWLLGVGIFLLYNAAVRDYGMFHMLDYPIFLGIAYFFLTSPIERGSWRKSGFIVLFAFTGITLLWAGIEKFAYPDWTYAMLEANPDMLFGLSPQTYMVLAGFVEVVVIFILLGAVSVGSRLVAVGLNAVFVLAIYKFGPIDAVGHLMIIAILVVLFVRGPTDAREILVLREKSVWMEAYFMTGLYYLAFVTAFILYYGLHSMSYG